MSDKNIDQTENEQTESEQTENEKIEQTTIEEPIKEKQNNFPKMKDLVSKVTKQTIISSLVFFVVGGVTVSIFSHENHSDPKRSQVADKGNQRDDSFENRFEHKKNKNRSNNPSEKQENKQKNESDNSSTSSEKNESSSEAANT